MEELNNTNKENSGEMKDILGEFCTFMKDELSTFSFLNAEDIKILSGFLKCKNIPAGKTLWKEGDPCHDMAFVISGRVEIKKETEFKGRQAVVGIYSKGAVVGELCFLDSSPRAVTAVALDNVSLALITREDFEKIIDKYKDLGVRLMKGMLISVSKRLRGSFGRLASFF